MALEQELWFDVMVSKEVLCDSTNVLAKSVRHVLYIDNGHVHVLS